MLLCQHQEKGGEKDKQGGLKKREKRGKKEVFFQIYQLKKGRKGKGKGEGKKKKNKSLSHLDNSHMELLY